MLGLQPAHNPVVASPLHAVDFALMSGCCAALCCVQPAELPPRMTGEEALSCTATLRSILFTCLFIATKVADQVSMFSMLALVFWAEGFLCCSSGRPTQIGRAVHRVARLHAWIALALCLGCVR